MAKTIGITIAVFCLAGIGLACLPVQVVTVTLPKADDRPIASIRMGTDDIIILSYRHSVELTAVEGRFRVGPGSEILAVETRMASVGTGLPNTFPERTRKADGWLIVDEGDKPVGPIRFYYVPINQTELKIAGRIIDLTPLESGSLVQIAAEKLILFQWLLRN